MKLSHLIVVGISMLLVGGFVGYRFGKDSTPETTKERSISSSNRVVGEQKPEGLAAEGSSSGYEIIRDSDEKRFVSEDPEEILNWYLSGELDEDDDPAFEKVIADLLENDPQRLRKFLEQANVEDGHIRRTVSHFLKIVAQKKGGGQILTDWAIENPDFYSQEELRDALKRVDWQATPDSLLQLASRAEHFRWVVATAIRRIAEEDPSVAREKMEKLLESGDFDSQRMEIAYAIGAGTAVSRAAEEDMIEMIATIGTNPRITRQMVTMVTNESPRKAGVVFDKLELDPSTDVYKVLVGEIAMSMSKEGDIEEAFEWLADKQTDGVLEGLIPDLISDLHRTDPERALEMCSNFDSEIKDDVFGTIAMRAKSATEAIGHVSAISEPTRRERAMERILVRWYYRNPSEVKRLLPDIQLTEKSLERLNQLMEETDANGGEPPREFRR